ncbi:hypothetical protein MP228_007863 [Amoeboaphelidium protococcarum]|nr:hypothetical protein MP228_007863 [Amoeboaphelidium protococcarum]
MISNYQKDDQPLTGIQQAISGGVAGLVSRFVVSPLDVVKIRLQIFQYQQRQNIFSVVRDIYHREGLTAFWKGNWSAEWLYLTYGGIQFSSYSVYRSFMSSYLDRDDRLQSYTASICGGLAGSTATFFSYPLDTLRTRFIAQTSHVQDQRQYQRVIQAVGLIYQTEGVGGFYRGFAASVMQIFPYMAIVFQSYESLQLALSTPNAQKFLNQYNRDFVCGALSGVIGKTCVMPLDTIRRRMQIQAPQFLTSIQSPDSQMLARNYIQVDQKVKFFRVGYRIVMEEGWRALFRGLLPALLKSAPGTATTFFVYERMKSLFNKNR